MYRVHFGLNGKTIYSGSKHPIESADMMNKLPFKPYTSPHAQTFLQGLFETLDIQTADPTSSG